MVDRQLANKARMAARVVISQLLPQLALLPTSYTMLQCTTTADDIKWIESKQIQLVFFILRIHLSYSKLSQRYSQFNVWCVA
jgi:hypothetical protein